MQEHDIYTPELIVAGAKEFGSAIPSEAAFNALAFSLDTESVAMVCRVIDNKVHYAGTPASSFLNRGDCYTQVFAALGAEDGAYLIDEAAYSLLMIKQDDLYQTFSGTYDQVRQQCDESGLSPKILDEGDEIARWQTLSFEDAKRSKSVNERIALLSGGVALACALGWIVMAGVQGGLVKSAYQYDLSAQNKIAQAIESIPTYQPVDRVMSELSTVKTVTAKSGGWIDRFHVKNNQVGFELSMPRWVTSDYIAPLGNVSATRDDKTQMISIKKMINEEG